MRYTLPSIMQFVREDERTECKTCNGMQFYRGQPDYSLANKLTFGVKTSANNYPVILKSLRRVQKLFIKMRASHSVRRRLPFRSPRRADCR